MSSFTPGPWKVIDFDDDYIAITDAEQQFGICRLEEDANESRPSMVANAHLLSAAPEMHAALKQILVFYNDFNTYPRVPMSEIRELIKRTISKAEGK